MAYRDVRNYLRVLEAKGKLRRITKEVERSWEISAVFRRTFQNIPDRDRPALIFENVEGFNVPVVGMLLGGSRDIYALAMETTVDDISEKWARSQTRPIPPVMVDSAPVHENVKIGAEANQDWIPIPTWSADDPSPYHAGPCVVSKHPDTGERNVGTYRLQYIDGKTMYMQLTNTTRNIYRHITANDANNQPTEVAIFFGGEPAINLASVSSVPYGVDEYGVAGAISGEPMELVKCKTVDLEVPACAEIVLEGKIRPKLRVDEGPFGEYTGYMSDINKEGYVIDIQAVTYRSSPIYQIFFSQMPPSESSVIRGTGREVAIYKHLSRDLRMPVTDCHFTHPGGGASTLYISVKKTRAALPQEVMWAAMAFNPGLSKIIVIVDDDIDVRNYFQVDWALAWHMQPHRDVYIFRDTEGVGLDPSLAPFDMPSDLRKKVPVSKMGIDATRKHQFTTLALPSDESLRKVDDMWDQYGIGN